jgi:hypothetical protein
MRRLWKAHSSIAGSSAPPSGARRRIFDRTHVGEPVERLLTEEKAKLAKLSQR